MIAAAHNRARGGPLNEARFLAAARVRRGIGPSRRGMNTMVRPGSLALLGLGTLLGVLGCSDSADPKAKGDAGVGGSGMVVAFTGGNLGAGAMTGNDGAAAGPADAGVSFVKDPDTGNCKIVMEQMGCTGAQYESE